MVRYFNTSHVNVNPGTSPKPITESGFQYISC